MKPAAPERYYLDYAATTPLRPEVFAAMEPWLTGGYGNPSSQHAEGRAAKAAIDLARERLAAIAGCEFPEVIFTSGATEAINLALIGSALGNETSRRRILMSAAEHHATLQTAPLLERMGYHVEILAVDREAKLVPETLSASLDDDVFMVAALHTNNEFGSINPIDELVELAHEAGALMLCDVVQAPIAAMKNSADFRVISAHKLGGPKGVGALIANAEVKLKPLIAGGEQERERRGGTENVAGIVGFGAAVMLDQAVEPGAIEAFIAEMPDDFLLTLPYRTSKIIHGRVPGLDAETLLIKLDRSGVAASSGAACSSGSVESSHVMLAAGYTPKEAKEGLRFSFGPGLTATQSKQAGEIVRQVIEHSLDRRRP